MINPISLTNVNSVFVDVGIRTFEKIDDVASCIDRTHGVQGKNGGEKKAGKMPGFLRRVKMKLELE